MTRKARKEQLAAGGVTGWLAEQILKAEAYLRHRERVAMVEAAIRDVDSTLDLAHAAAFVVGRQCGPNLGGTFGGRAWEAQGFGKGRREASDGRAWRGAARDAVLAVLDGRSLTPDDFSGCEFPPEPELQTPFWVAAVRAAVGAPEGQSVGFSYGEFSATTGGATAAELAAMANACAAKAQWHGDLMARAMAIAASPAA